MADIACAVLLDQNIPIAVTSWLRSHRCGWQIWHVNEIGLVGENDSAVYLWAQRQHATIVTYDEDFADSRFYHLGSHFGIVRLRVWPTTTEKTIEALDRLIEKVDCQKWPGSLMIVDNDRIRIRQKNP